MLQLSEKMLIFVPSFGKRRRHRGERLSFDPPENLQNSKYKGEKSESCFSCSSIYTALSCVESVRIYTCRCELIFILTYTGVPGLSDLGCQEGSHSLYIRVISRPQQVTLKWKLKRTT